MRVVKRNDFKTNLILPYSVSTTQFMSFQSLNLTICISSSLEMSVLGLLMALSAIYCLRRNYTTNCGLFRRWCSSCLHYVQVSYLPMSVIFTTFKRENVKRPLEGFGVLIPSKEQENGLRTLGNAFFFFFNCRMFLSMYFCFKFSCLQAPSSHQWCFLIAHPLMFISTLHLLAEVEIEN